MQNVRSEIRGKLLPYLGQQAEDDIPAGYGKYGSSLPPGNVVSRFVRKIPAANYEELPRRVPISWL